MEVMSVMSSFLGLREKEKKREREREREREKERKKVGKKGRERERERERDHVHALLRILDMNSKNLHDLRRHVDVRLGHSDVGEAKCRGLSGVRCRDQDRRHILRAHTRRQRHIPSREPSSLDAKWQTPFRPLVVDDASHGAEGVDKRADRTLFHPLVARDDRGVARHEHARRGQESRRRARVAEIPGLE